MSDAPKETPAPAPAPADAPKQEAPKVDAPAKDTTPTPEPKPEAKQEPKAGDSKPGEQPVVKYDLKLPEGSLLDAAHVEKVASFAKERNLSNEQAQAILEREHHAVKSHVDGSKVKLKQMSEGWKAEIAADKDFGGDAFKENAELSKRFLARFGDESLLDALDDSGLGNHPGLFKMIVRAAKSMSEDKLILPGREAGTKKPIEELFYGPSEQKP